MKCPQKKERKKEHVVAATGEALLLSLEFEFDFTLIACIEITIMGSMCYLDNGASIFMTGNINLLNNLEEKDLKYSTEFGYDERSNMIGIGTITFHRESSSKTQGYDFVPVLKRN